jgi:hypothetical protein
MTIKQGAIASVICLISFVCNSPARPKTDDVTPPQLINLDIPPDDPPDPAEVQERSQTFHAVQLPQFLHDLLLKLFPDREPREVAEALAILHPDILQNGQPDDAATALAKGNAANAIQHPRPGF